jgi:hypothetical protein
MTAATELPVRPLTLDDVTRVAQLLAGPVPDLA